MFDAYTVKKMLPRLVIAIIAIQLSWFLFTELIQIVNHLAFGIEGLLYAPFGGAHELELKQILTNASGTGQNGMFFGALILGGGAAIGLGGFLSLAIMVLLALFIGFVMLVLRKVLIFFLLILAPLALVAWILPGTEKYFKLWWDNFFKLLLLYPMVLGVVAAGRVFAHVAAASKINSVTQLLIIVVGCFGPFFLIPKLFQLSGSAFASINGATRNLSRGAFGGLNNRRKAKQAENIGKFKAGERLSERNRFNKRLNKIGAGVSQGVGGHFGLGAKGRANVERIKTARTAERLKEPGVNEMLMDDDVRGVLAVGNQRADDFLKAKGIAEGSKEYKEIMGTARSIGFSSSSRLAALQGETTHGKGRNMEAISAAYGVAGDESAGMRAVVNDVGRSAGMQGEGVERLMQNTMYSFGANGVSHLRQKSVDEVMDNKFDTGLLRGITPSAMEALAGGEVTRLQTGTPDQQSQAAAQLLSMHENRVGMSEPAIKELDAALTTAGINLDSTDESIDTQLAKKVAGTATATTYDTTKAGVETATARVRGAEQAVADEVASLGTASPATMAQLAAARTAQVTANNLHKTSRDAVHGTAQQLRAQSATYGSTSPVAAREQVT